MYLPYLIAFPVFALSHLRSNSHPLFISDTLSRIYILFLFSHTLLILLLICPSVHIYLQTWHASHKSPFQSAYFSHALEFFFFSPPFGHAAQLNPPHDYSFGVLLLHVYF